MNIHEPESPGVPQAVVTLDYWIGVSECTCGSTNPSGGCLHCDLVNVRSDLLDTIEALTSFTENYE